MDLKPITRASSTGYRLPGRAMGTRATTEGLSGTARCKGQAAHGDKDDPVKRDQFWREMVWRQRRAALEWEENWDSNKEFYQTGLVKPEEPLPNYVSLFSDHVPNTANQIVGSRLYTPLGRELVRLDRLILWPAGRCK
ncbi:ciliary microtubule inner protein 5 [Archocentrus centrarchus]|uniref:ciliary microtubule inner protein 5 n=1 Tax=Archocentrus centrarchus TaxID=63155 RepID=UPI0011E9D313|nr:uncharacterized protein C2orf50 homolog [Archocentrus centrarchus]